MRQTQFKMLLLIFLVCCFTGTTAFAQDKNFHIYLCLGQSNMEGHGQFEPQDTILAAIEPRAGCNGHSMQDNIVVAGIFEVLPAYM